MWNAPNNRGGKFCIRFRGIGPEHTQQPVILAYTGNAYKSIRGAQVGDRIVGSAAALNRCIQCGVDTDGIIGGQNHNFVRSEGVQVGCQRVAVCIAAVHVISLVGKDGKSVPVDDQKIQPPTRTIEYGLAIQLHQTVGAMIHTRTAYMKSAFGHSRICCVGPVQGYGSAKCNIPGSIPGDISSSHGPRTRSVQFPLVATDTSRTNRNASGSCRITSRGIVFGAAVDGIAVNIPTSDFPADDIQRQCLDVGCRDKDRFQGCRVDTLRSDCPGSNL